MRLAVILIAGGSSSAVPLTTTSVPPEAPGQYTGAAPRQTALHTATRADIESVNSSLHQQTDTTRTADALSSFAAGAQALGVNGGLSVYGGVRRG
jgi:hypothetical protein